ncbi:hypothetical protein K488DRAFT_74244 [Vararia minispora EC-137]|uniref:Uncharacterized protein n=1 Tax=Vararia minispora EC-137 TaxID=1314806 RepID=A0ACB8Q8B9_9AGAM|nr:hypothetical protein K488DRAFT_74244 [Vararia minispora EC-137]
MSSEIATADKTTERLDTPYAYTSRNRILQNLRKKALVINGMDGELRSRDDTAGAPWIIVMEKPCRFSTSLGETPSETGKWNRRNIAPCPDSATPQAYETKMRTRKSKVAKAQLLADQPAPSGPPKPATRSDLSKEVRAAQRHTAKESAEARQKVLDDAKTTITGERVSKTKAYKDPVWLKPGAANKGRSRKRPLSPDNATQDGNASIAVRRRRIDALGDNTDRREGSNMMNGSWHIFLRPMWHLRHLAGGDGNEMDVDGVDGVDVVDVVDCVDGVGGVDGVGDHQEEFSNAMTDEHNGDTTYPPDEGPVVMADEGVDGNEAIDNGGLIDLSLTIHTESYSGAGDRQLSTRDDLQVDSDNDSGDEYAPSIQPDNDDSDGSDLEQDEEFDEPEHGASSKALSRTRRLIQAQLDLAKPRIVNASAVLDPTDKKQRAFPESVFDSGAMLGDDEDCSITSRTMPSQAAEKDSGKGDLAEAHPQLVGAVPSGPRPRMVFKPVLPTAAEDVFELEPKPKGSKFKPNRRPIVVLPSPSVTQILSPPPTTHAAEDRALTPSAPDSQVSDAEEATWPDETIPVYDDEARTVIAGLRSQPRQVKALLHYACNHSMAELLYCRNAYPNHSTLLEMAEESLFVSAKRQALGTIERRLNLDPPYARYLAELPYGRVSVLRGNVYHTAENIVPRAYDLYRFDGDPSKMALAVSDLLLNYSYLYPGSFKANGRWHIKDKALIFYHPAFAKIASKAFMDGVPFQFHESVFPASISDPARRELPDAMVAFIGVTIHATLQTYITGEWVQRPFDAACVREAYSDHVATIGSSGFAPGKHPIFQELYSDARKLVGSHHTGVALAVAPGLMIDIEAHLKKIQEDDDQE